jgi:GntR family transcriptional regulator
MPLWAQVADDLRRRIADREFTGRFPTDQELVTEYDVSRHTVREALRRLSDDGVLERHRGRGTFLVAHPELQQPVRGMYSLASSIVAQGLDEYSHVLSRGECVDPEAAVALELPPDAPLVYVERLRFAGGEPLALDHSFLPRDAGALLLEADLTHGSLYALLTELGGIQVTGGSERITATVPDAAMRALLRLPDGQAALAIERVARAGDRAIERRLSLVRGDRYSFTSEW